MEGYFPAKLKRKDLDEVNDDFCDFSLSSPARKIRRLDAELPTILEEEESFNPVVYGQPVSSEDPSVKQAVSLPENEERAIVLFDPGNNMPSLQPRSPFSVSVSPQFLSGFKNRVLYSNRSCLLKSLDGITEKEKEDGGKCDGSTLAVVPWVPMHSQEHSMPEPCMEVCEMMDEDDHMEVATTMDIEEDDNSQSQQSSTKELGCEGVNQWQQHCLVPPPPAHHNLSTPVAWSG